MGAWRLIVDPPGEPTANMARDEELARLVREDGGPAVFRIYRWIRPAVSLGRRQKVDDLPRELLKRNLPVAHRPTGGGAVVHRAGEVSYSIALPRRSVAIPVKELPLLFHRFLREALIEAGFVLSSVHPEQAVCPSTQLRANGASKEDYRRFAFCFESPVCGDILYQGRKVAGSALRAWKDGILLQGSLQEVPVSYPRLVGAVLLAARRFFGLDQESAEAGI